MKNLRLVVVGLIAVTLTQASAFASAFSIWNTNTPVLVATGMENANGDAVRQSDFSTFDVVASISGDYFYKTYSYNHTADGQSQGISQYHFVRDGNGKLVSIADDTSSDAANPDLDTSPLNESAAVRRDWQIDTIGGPYAVNGAPSTPDGGGYFPKSLAVLAETAGSVRLVVANQSTSTNGSIQFVTSTARTQGTTSQALWQDLANQRYDGGAYYGPEGIAVDRTHHVVAVVTDNLTGYDQSNPSVRFYTYDPGTFAVNGTLTNVLLSGVASPDARQAIALPSGAFLLRAGAANASHQLLKIDPTTGTVTTILTPAQISKSSAYSVQDQLVFNNYLYVSYGNGEISAFPWDSVTETVTSTTPEVLNVDQLLQTYYGLSTNSQRSLTGLDVTTNGELLVTFGGGATGVDITGGVFAFNLLDQAAVPEPSTMLLFALGGWLVWRRRALLS